MSAAPGRRRAHSDPDTIPWPHERAVSPIPLVTRDLCCYPQRMNLKASCKTIPQRRIDIRLMTDSEHIQSIRRGLKFICILLVFGYLTHLPATLGALRRSEALYRDIMGTTTSIAGVGIVNSIFDFGLTWILILLGFVAYLLATIRAKSASFLYSTAIIVLCLIWTYGAMLSLSQALLRAPMERLTR